MRRLCFFVLLAACRNKPVDVVAEIEIVPVNPGDHIELYFGTVPRNAPLSEIAANQLAIDQVQAYAVDKIGPHLVPNVPADLVLDISEPLPTLSMVIAFEDNGLDAAATAIDLSDSSAPVYLLKLQPVDPAAGFEAAEWGPSNPSADQGPKECAYYNGLDGAGKPLAAAIVVDTDTATTVAPYVDLDCDGYHASSNMNNQSLECDDHEYDSMGRASDDSTCVAPYSVEDDCMVVGQPCKDGKVTSSSCPDTITAQNLTKWCVPTGYCTDTTTPYASLADIIATPSETYGAVVCEVAVDVASGDPCAQMITATVQPDGAICTAPMIDIEIGVGGPPYDNNASIPNSDADVSVSQQSELCAIELSLGGDWTALAVNPIAPMTTLMLALTPDGSARGLVLPLELIVTPTTAGLCAGSTNQCTVSIPSATSDTGLMTCINAP